MDNILKPFGAKHLKFDWKFGLFLILLVCIPRFLLVLDANEKRNFTSIAIIMVISAIVPFVFLTKQGLRQMGIIKPKSFYRLMAALIAGLIFSILLYYIGEIVGGNTYRNWYVYIGKPYSISQSEKLIWFMMYCLNAMTFSPIGEELFFRGIVHSAFAQSIGDKKASLVDSSAFAITHLSHFGLVFVNNKWELLAVPALIWMIAMFMASILFFIMKKYSGSIQGAVICHAGFNLGMGYSIFYLL